MQSTQRLGFLVAFLLVAPLSARPTLSAQVLPNPYRLVDGWAQLPNGILQREVRLWGRPGASR